MDKVIRNGKVAVVYSPEYGAGWSTWGDDASPFDPAIVEWIEAGKDPSTMPYKDDAGGKDVYCGGLPYAEIEWLPVGMRFEITEYDGAEFVRLLSPDDGYVA